MSDVGPSLFSIELTEMLFEAVTTADRISQPTSIIGTRWNLALFLGSLHTYGLTGKPLKKASGMSIEVERKAVEIGALMLAGGDGRIHQLLDRLRVPAPINVPVQLISEAFPSLLTKLRHRLGPQEQERLLRTLRAYISNSTAQEVAITWRERGAARVRNVQRTAEALGIRKESIRRLLKQQGLSPKVRISSAGRNMLVFGEDELRRVETALVSALAKREVAKAFGISSARQDGLIESGLLKAVGRKVDRASIDKLFEKLHQVCQPIVDVPKEDLVSLSEALRSIVPRHETVYFFVAMISNRLKVTRIPGDRRMAECIWLARAELVRLLVEQRAADAGAISLPEAAGILGVKQEVLYHLVNTQHISTHMQRLGRRVSRMVTRAELERFMKEVETLSDAATRAGVSRQGAFTWAKRNGMKFVSGPSIDGGRQYFVRRIETGSPDF